MGYTHYWYRKPTLSKNKFVEFSKDCQKIFDYSQNDLGIALEDPIANDKIVIFNGSDEQDSGIWTTQENISIPWPSPTASLSEAKEMAYENKTNGSWFAGDMVEQRVAPISNLTGKGMGSYETFCIKRSEKQVEWRKGEKLIFNCCKTAYRPYDLVVTAVLIAFKYHFPDAKVSSDGDDKDWLDGQFLCNNLLGYGLEFKL